MSNEGWTGNNIIFRTYFYGDDSEGNDGKSPKEGVKGKTGHSFNEVIGSRCFGAALNDGIVDISFDTKEMFDTFLDIAEAKQWKCLALPSDHGGHSFWRKGSHFKKKSETGTDKKLACGFIADIKHGNTYIPLRVHGRDRFPPEYDILEGEDYDIVPEELLPVETDINLYGLGEGDGRNDSLFRYILILQSQLGLPDDRIRTMYREVINRFILKNPLPEDELSVILRDEAFSQITEAFWKDKVFLHYKFAGFLMEHDHIIRLYEQLHIYENGVYVADPLLINQRMRKYIPTIRNNNINEVSGYIRDMAERKKPAPPKYIAFQNGVYDIETDKLIPHSPDIVITNMIPWDYDPAAYSEIADRFLNDISCNDPEIRALLEECIGYCFYREVKFKSAFFLTGDRDNGKSTFLEALGAVLGEDNTVSLDMAEIKDKHTTGMIGGKLANIGDDIEGNYISEVSLFKKITDGNRIKADPKGISPYNFRPYTKMVFSANSIPGINDPTGAATKRMIIIPFDACFDRDDPKTDKDMKKKLRQAAAVQYFIKIGVEGLKRILRNNGFTKSARVSRMQKEYILENDPLTAFIEETGKNHIINTSSETVFKEYDIFCCNNGFRLSGYTKNKFSRDLNKRFNIESDGHGKYRYKKSHIQ